MSIADILERLRCLEGSVSQIGREVISISTDLKHKPDKLQMWMSVFLAATFVIGGIWAVFEFAGPPMFEAAVRQVLAK